MASRGIIKRRKGEGVWTGAVLLKITGVLDGRRATTNKLYFKRWFLLRQL